MISVANSNDSDHYSSLFSWLLDRQYQIRFYGMFLNIKSLAIVIRYALHQPTLCTLAQACIMEMYP